MKSLTYILLATSLAAQAANILPGVSQELAHERKQCLDSVKYNIAFHYPGADDTKFRIDQEILFHYAGGLADCLQIDFAGDELGPCTVNGTAINPEWTANHILIPADLLLLGQNAITIQCCSSDKALNANPSYMYTLFVPANAHSAIPCFDQPDIKAQFTPTLHIPAGYQCMSSMSVAAEAEGSVPGTKAITFKESPQLPTYLISWVIGDFQIAEVGDMTVLHNESDSLKVAQIPEMCRISSNAIKWLEEYTDMPYPFQKYGFAIIPGFQFGGMEHPGAILYPPETTFLSQSPTPEELLWRYELIAHETSHMWFGDLVTMRWFDDVWTKEVFANFMASKISSQAFPDIDHNFNFIRGNYPAAYYTDRTDGTHPIAQDLDNLSNAGLVYGNIIYNKAPVMMRMLEKRIGEDRLRDGLRAYLRKYALANSSWDELIQLLDSVAPDADVKGFSEAWVKQKGMPTIATEYNHADRILIVTQHDPTGAGIVWPQSFTVLLVGTDGTKKIAVNLFEKEISVPVDATDIGAVTAVIPNSHGDGYGYFQIADYDSYLGNWDKLENDGRYGAILNLTNAWVKHDLDSQLLQDMLTQLLPAIDNPIIAAAAVDVLATMAAQNQIDESILWNIYDGNPVETSNLKLHTCAPGAHTSNLKLETCALGASVRQKLLRSLYSQCVSQPSADRLYAIWEGQTDSLLNQRDYMAMAYRLAILKPEAASQILAVQRQRIADNQNLVREFDFISRACTADTDSLLAVLQLAENRRPEPWTSKLLALIFDPARQHTDAQLQLALDMLPEIQATGGIFFPTHWARSIVAGIRTPENKKFLTDYCSRLNPSSPLHRKILESSFISRQFPK